MDKWLYIVYICLLAGHILYNLWCAILNHMRSYWTLLYCFSLCKREKTLN